MRRENQIRKYRLGAGPASMIPTNTSQPLSEEEIIRQLRIFRYAPENRAARRGGRAVPLKFIAELAGFNRRTLYRLIMGGPVSLRSRSVLSRVLIMLQSSM